MITPPYEKMVCDSKLGDGGIYFYEEYCEWVNRKNSARYLRIYYRDIDDITIRSGIKKTVTVLLKDGQRVFFYLYKAATLKEILYKAIQRINGEVVDNKPTDGHNDLVDELERLAKLHDAGALTDEEYALAKQKLL